MARAKPSPLAYPTEYWTIFDKAAAGEQVVLNFGSPAIAASMRTRFYGFLSSIQRTRDRILANKAPELSESWCERIRAAAEIAPQVTTISPEPHSLRVIICLRDASPEARRLREALGLAEPTVGLPVALDHADRQAESGPVPTPEMLRIAGLRRGGTGQ